MSVYVDELIKDMRDNPLEWNEFKGHGIRKDNIVICQYGNSSLLSVIDVVIKGKSMPITYWDRWKLEVAVGKWYKSIPLTHISKYDSR